MVKGFSLLELLIALTISFVIALTGFQLFRQYERLFQSQNQQLEAEQNLRAVMFQINDEIRRAGQGMPVFAGSFDAVPSEALALVLNGSDASHLRIREGYSGTRSEVVTNPAGYRIGMSRPVTAGSVLPFANALGTNSPLGRFAYVWGAGSDSCWSWVRAQLTGLDTAAGILTMIPRQIGDNCRAAPDTVQFTASQTVELEEAVSIYLNAGSIWRATAIDITNPSAPLWAAASELARDISQLTFTYYDSRDIAVIPDSAAVRLSVARIDVSARSVSGAALSMQGYPRNARVR